MNVLQNACLRSCDVIEKWRHIFAVKNNPYMFAWKSILVYNINDVVQTHQNNVKFQSSIK